jgi:hypothetical protein
VTQDSVPSDDLDNEIVEVRFLNLRLHGLLL